MEPNEALDSLIYMRDDKLLTKIAALLRQAEGTDNPHEAETFMQAAQRLATAASIDLAVARSHDPAGRKSTVPVSRQIAIGEKGKRGLRTYVQLFVAIARANDVTVDVAGNSTFVLAYGFADDIDTCETLYTSLVVQMVAGTTAVNFKPQWRPRLWIKPQQRLPRATVGKISLELTTNNNKQ